MKDISLSLSQLKTLLNYTSKGTFTTKAENTRGTIQIGADGQLRNVGRHWYNRTSSTTNAQDNFTVRRALVETFRANNASNEFIAKLRERLGLSTELLSNGRIDEKGNALSAKPLERRVLKQIITDFESIQGNRNTTTDKTVVHPKVAFDVQRDRLKSIGDAFLNSLNAGMVRCGFSESLAYSIHMSTISETLNSLATEVLHGKRTPFSALMSLACTIDRLIGPRSVDARMSDPQIMRQRYREICIALDDFAKNLGAEGKHPFEEAMLANAKSEVLCELRFKPFPAKASAKKQAAFIDDFAKRIWKACENPYRLFNFSRGTRGENAEACAEFFDKVFPSSFKSYVSTNSDFSAFLKGVRGDDNKFADIRKMISDMQNKRQDVKDQYYEKTCDPVNDTKSQIEANIKELEKNLDTARTNGDENAIKNLTEEIGKLRKDLVKIQFELEELSEEPMRLIAETNVLCMLIQPEQTE